MACCILDDLTPIQFIIEDHFQTSRNNNFSFNYDFDYWQLLQFFRSFRAFQGSH